MVDFWCADDDSIAGGDEKFREAVVRVRVYRLEVVDKGNVIELNLESSSVNLLDDSEYCATDE